MKQSTKRYQKIIPVISIRNFWREMNEMKQIATEINLPLFKSPIYWNIENTERFNFYPLSLMKDSIPIVDRVNQNLIKTEFFAGKSKKRENIKY